MSEKETVTRGELVKAAKELNDVLFEEDDKQRIDIKANAKVLDQKIREASTLLANDDEMSEETLTTLKTIGADLPESMGGPASGTEDGDDDPGTEEQEQEEEVETEKIDTTAAVKSAKVAKKVAELQAIAKEMGVRIAPPFLKDLKKCRDYVVEKLQKLATEGRPVKREKVKKERKAGGKRGPGPGIIATIFEFVSKATAKSPVKKDDILAHLKEKFPEREEKSMSATINVQLPGRMAREKNINIVKNAEGAFYVK